jgi:hypothetical protein
MKNIMLTVFFVQLSKKEMRPHNPRLPLGQI